MFIADFWTFLDKDQAFLSRLAAKLEETRLRTYRRGVSFINDPLSSPSASRSTKAHNDDSKGKLSKSSEVAVIFNFRQSGS